MENIKEIIKCTWKDCNNNATHVHYGSKNSDIHLCDKHFNEIEKSMNNFLNNLPDKKIN